MKTLEKPKNSSRTHLHGVLVVDKEKEWTSHDVCAFVKSRFHLSKVGHAGTLDPMATGVLVVLLGNATKRSQDISSCDKDYYGTMRLGIQTDTHDITGKVLQEGIWNSLTEGRIQSVFGEFKGNLEQTPPMVSALKHKGVRLYKIARAGKTVDRPSRMVTVHELRIEKIELPEIWFFARVSKGTYLRTLVNDLGERLGSFAALSGLRRVRSGNFKIEDAVTIDSLRSLAKEELFRLVRRAESNDSATLAGL